ncbi:phosphomevalonate kinase, peroxisomal-like isoform X2 [Durio zibethinus]|uniref:phosphomevalonate kinase n=1 Tax=Durio zibethinus TaxID=66656 RepID=A0A6P5Y7F8_DURZI|nr:phosphomevalonate kinase, peroxisomal-like isoform X2 [Durio zibethinus]
MEVVASAPGKVLLTGGYLILERPNAGIVLSTNARFYAIVKPIYEDFKPESWAWAWTDVKLTSPQLSRESMYKLSLKHLTLQCVSSSESRNPFVENAIQYAVAAAHAVLDKNKKDALDKLLLQGLEITILGCNDFYSYRNQIEARGLPLTPEALAALPPFTSITFNAGESNGGNCKPEVAKTGLGSSAAMTTAAVAALLHYLGVVNLSAFSEDPHQQNKDSMDLDVVHMIAQSAHCVAQGKVGSGFDVSSAVYGSQRYVRFSPKVLSAAQAAVEGMSLEEVIGNILNGEWDHERTEFSLPPLMTLWMEGVAEPVKDELVKVLLKAREAMLGIRNHIRQMGQAAGIPIEPESQTELLDATMNMEGVLLAGVPGAGGFDAIFAVALGDSSSNVANAWSSRNVLALLVREDPQGVSLESGDPRSWEITSAVSSIHIK